MEIKGVKEYKQNRNWNQVKVVYWGVYVKGNMCVIDVRGTYGWNIKENIKEK